MKCCTLLDLYAAGTLHTPAICLWAPVTKAYRRGESWQRHVVDAGAPGLDHHDGTILADLDGDGDLDIASVGWESVSLVIYENLALTWGGARRDAQPAEEQARTSFWDYLLNWW